MSTFVLHANNANRSGVLSNAQKFLAALNAEKSWQVTVKPYSKPRTCEANAYLWGVVYPTIVRELSGIADDWHELFCIEFFGERSVELGETRIVKPVRSTTTDETGKRDVLPSGEFWRFVEFVSQRAAEAGVYIAAPNEVAA
jgi:hypothetical protein